MHFSINIYYIKHILMQNTTAGALNTETPCMSNKLKTQLITYRWRNINSCQIHMLNKIVFKTYSVLFKQH